MQAAGARAQRRAGRGQKGGGVFHKFVENSPALFYGAAGQAGSEPVDGEHRRTGGAGGGQGLGAESLKDHGMGGVDAGNGPWRPG